MIRVDVAIADPASVLATGAFGAGALIRLERAPAIGGTYAEITTMAVVATTTGYTYWDSAGTSSSWYRWRFSGAAGSPYSSYSPAFQGTDPAAPPAQTYASLNRLLGMFSTRPTGAQKLARLQQLLGVATGQLIEACGHRDFFAHPADGTTAAWYETRRETSRRGDRWDDAILHVHGGIVSPLTSLEVSLDNGSTYSAVASSDYVLRGDDPESDEPLPAGEPAFHVVLTGAGTTVAFPRGTNVVRLTGTRGWPAIPEVLAEACVQRARQLAWAEGSYSGAMAGGEDEFGSPAPTDRFWPQSVWNFIHAQNSRFDGCRA